MGLGEEGRAEGELALALGGLRFVVHRLRPAAFKRAFDTAVRGLHRRLPSTSC
jgi:hypothetical protein